MLAAVKLSDYSLPIMSIIMCDGVVMCGVMILT